MIINRRMRAAIRLLALGSALSSGTAFAQEVAPEVQESAEASTASQDTPGEIVITGSRVLRSGFSAPTPVTVVGAERLQALGDNNVADALNRLPAFRAQSTPTSQGFTQANLGSQLLDLRALGAQRTLVLLNGRRIAPSTTQGTVDINLIPSSIISRTEVVTGGASAAYGSDAVAGVVNLILDTRFNGFRASAQFGITDEGDGEEVQASLAFGSELFGGRGHIVFAGEYVNNDGIGDCFTRRWCSPDGISNYNVTANPGGAGAGGLPATVVGLVRNATMTPAGLITNGPLRGTQFTPSGGVSTTPFVFGTNASPFALFMIGGSGENYFHQNLLINPPVERYSLYQHLSYDFSDSIRGFLETSYGNVRVRANSAVGFDFGSIVIQRSNAFLPAEIATRMDTLGITSFNMGRVTREAGQAVTTANRSAFRAVAGLEGDLGGGWQWDAYYQFGETQVDQTSTNNKISANFTRAVDSVIGPNGQPICRSTLTDPTNGCQPLNPFGEGNISAGALGYAFGTGQSNFRYRQNVLAANVRGEPFSTWAGPVSFAVGGEFREDSARGTVDSISAVSGFFTNNAAAINGKIQVLEGYAETVVPLARELPFARTLELNGAIRQTHYRRSNDTSPTTTVDATTWKIGAIWEPISAIRFRATRSRDIRAPNTVELFSSLAGSLTFINDSVTNQAYNVRTFTGGNPGLAPEKADTLTLGVVLQPSLGSAGSLRFSVDYYDIDLEGAIAQLGGQLIVNRCIAGNADFCALITRDPTTNLLTTIQNQNLNLNGLQVRGIDFDLDYNIDLSTVSANLPGRFEFRALATHTIDLATIDSAGVRTDRAGQNGAPASQVSGVPDWVFDLTASYRNGPFNVLVNTRTLTGGKYDVTLVGPGDEGYAITRPNSISDNRVGGRTYVNLAASYDLTRSLQLFGSINNLFDTSPPIAPSSVGGGYNPVLYDPTGREYNVGARLRF